MRSQIVSEKTITVLMDILDIPLLSANGRWSRTLEKLGQCISYAMLFTLNEKSFKDIIIAVQKNDDMPSFKLKTYLEIILIVLEA